MTSDKTDFSIEDPEFDETTLIGRLLTFQKTANPFHAFYSNTRINQMRELIKQQE